MNALQKLYWDGIVQLEQRFPYCEEVDAYLRKLPIHDGHVPLRGDGTVARWGQMRQRASICPPIVGGTLTAPHFLEFILNFTDFVEEYLGGFPYLYSTHSFWTRPSKDPLNDDIQKWHVDRDADKFVTLFIFGCDILNVADGPHVYKKQSHRYPGGVIAPYKFFGPVGTCLMVDTRGYHMGLRPTKVNKLRLLHWARWCIGTEPRSYAWDQMKPIPASQVPLARPNERLRESTKLLVDWT